ncbi:MAG: penicillin acylase family protein [Solirubrobacteraceae bacterium]
MRISLRRMLAAVLLSIVAAPVAQAAAAGDRGVTIRRTAHGIPHITASSWEKLGYGYAWALAHDNICPLANSYVTVDAERSRYFGPDARDQVGGNGLNPSNVDSDVFYAKIIKQRRVEDLIAQPLPTGPAPELKQLARGYTAGYNAALADMGGAAGITDPKCKDAAWVKPIEQITVWRRFYQLALLASSGVAIDGIAQAKPAIDLLGAVTGQAGALAGSELKSRLEEVLGGIGSNAVGLGKDATADGGGLLLGNPHFPWSGTERFYESHLTIPGELDVAGGSLLGVPLINIGFTKGLAWSHTVSTARRFVPYELKLLPNDPHQYYVDGQPRRMIPTTVTIQAKQADGSLAPVTRTLYDTTYGPILTSILGLPVFPWTPERAYAMFDANDQFRLLNHFFEVNQLQTVGELDALERRVQGIPWVNTIAVDAGGRAYYADIGSIPNVDEDKRLTCEPPLGVVLDQVARLPVLDGSRSACAPGVAAGAAAPGILPPSRQPSLFRDDYVTNSNDSYWLTNPQAPLEGFPRIIGDERTARATRTRIGLIMTAERSDWTPQRLMDMVFSNRQYLGELWRDDLVGMCRTTPNVPPAACDALAAWDQRDDNSSKGAVLFRRFATRALGVIGGPWVIPFSASDPVNTPRGLNVLHPQVRQALQDAVSDVQNAKIPFDAPLGDWQYVLRNEKRIPIHGGPGGLGVFNAINVGWNPQKGYPEPPHGSSYVQVVAPGGECPDAHTILTYSQSVDPTSPWYSDQTELYSRKEWVKLPFCAADVAAATISRERLKPGTRGG